MKKNFLLLLFVALISSQLAAQGNAPEGPSSPTRSGTIECLAPFYHGVASGDPLSDRVILWTRVTTDSSSVNVKWRIATDTNMVNLVDSGMVTTNAAKDYTVKVDVTGLQPFRYYFYEFEAYGKFSVRGRTRTLPVGTVDSLRFAVVSCANYTDGYYNAYAKITERNDIMAVIHLGDYIYEYGGGTAPHNHEPNYEILNLSDYRMRHSHYKLDEDLMRLHQQYPFYAVWDDHETANNSWYGGAQNHTPSTEGNWFNRKAAGVQAYYEWMPLRMPDLQDTQRIYRRFQVGNLLDLHMLDTRLQGREEQNGSDNSPNRTLLGTQQFNWLCAGMKASTAKWQILGQQVMMAPLNVQPISAFPPYYPNDDQWDGYPAERKKIYDTVLTNNIKNFVVLTGDIHTSWANDLPTSTYNPSTGAGSAGVEFVATSITSQGSPQPISQSVIQSVNRHIKYVDLTKHGYVLLDVNHNRTQGEWYFVDQISTRGSQESYTTGWFVNNNERHLRMAPGPASPHPSMIGTQAPLFPRNYNPNCNDTTSSAVVNLTGRESVLLGVYPNPFNQQVTLQFSLHQSAKTSVKVYDALGKVVAQVSYGQLNAGMHELPVNLDGLNAGAYVLVIEMGDKRSQRKLIKGN